MSQPHQSNGSLSAPSGVVSSATATKSGPEEYSRARRRTISDKAKDLFRKKPGDKVGEPVPTPPPTLAYQPRLKTPSRTPPASVSIPEQTSSESSSSPANTIRSRRASQHLAPLDVAAASHDAASPSASATPRAVNAIVVDDAEMTPISRGAAADVPLTPRPTSSGSGRRMPSPEHHHFRHPFHRPLRTRLLHTARKPSADLTTANATGEMDMANLPIGAAFPVAPSYHERAHPTLQPPKVAFSLIDGPASHSEPFTTQTLPPPRLQRPAIKVKIITWNMGGAALPKGDLEVLLGRVGGYVPPEEDWDLEEAEGTYGEEAFGPAGDAEAGRRSSSTRGKGIPGQEHIPRHDRIPPLPHDDGHPYHLLVVAGQECPWGDGKRIATGLGVAGELGDLARSKSKASHLNKSKDANTKIDGANGIAIPQTPATFGPGLDPSTPAAAIGGESFPFGSPPPTGTQGAAGVPAHGRVFGGKGWSDMCEDWLCRGPAAQSKATKGLAATTDALVHGSIATSRDVSRDPSRAASPSPSSRDFSSPLGSRAASPVFGSPPSKPAALASNRRGSAVSASLAIPSLPSFGRSASSGLLGVAGEGKSSTSPLPTPPPPVVRDFGATTPTPSGPSPPSSTHKPAPAARQGLQIKIPGQADEIDGTPLALGPYELLVKERCAMIYMAVYCWRGCRDRVRGFDRAHVKSGLLAGRVGNKGAVGISVKLGQTRLLFVNSHLAAHEGRIQTRLDNIAKIKKELRVDTFLSEKDPINRLADVTGMFDHAFWCGDLNFRIDISRQHADWLIMNQRYDQALEFDQLRKVMKEGREFQSFKEHEICFPPTYKYDVLKTLKKPKREKTVRRILRRRGHTASSTVAAALAGNGGDETDEDPDETSRTIDANETMETAITKRSSMISFQDDEDSDDEDDASSSSSIGPWGGSVGSSGFTGPLSESDHSGPSDLSVDPVVSSNTNAASGAQLFSHGAAIKAKWRIMDFVRSATGVASEGSEKSSKASKRKSKDLAGAPTTAMSSGSAVASPITPTSTRSGSSSSASHKVRSSQAAASLPPAEAGRQPTPMSSPSKKGQPGRRSSELSRQMSLQAASSAPILSPNGINDVARRDSQGSLDVFSNPTTTDATYMTAGENTVGGVPITPQASHDGGGSMTVDRHTSPKSSPSKRLSPGGRRRRSSVGDLESMFKRSDSATQKAGGGKDKASAEAQPYDTSAKQRVPSWTDRILWRTNIKPAPAPTTLATIGEHAPAPQSETPLGSAFRASKGLTQALRGAAGGGGGGGAPASDSQDTRAAAGPHQRQLAPSRSQTFSHPFKSDSAPQTAPAASSASSPLIERSSLPQGPASAVPASPLSRTDSPLDIAAPQDESPTTVSAPKHSWMRPRRTFSADHSASFERPGVRRGTSSPRMSMLRLSSRPSTPEGSNATGEGRESRARSRNVSEAEASGMPASASPSADSTPARRRAVSGNRSPSPPSGARRLSSWWATHIPTILTAQGAAAAFASLTSTADKRGSASSGARVRPELDIIGPRRGEVECLLYKSLDDGEMRALEGRSDHRPVIFVGSIGI